MSELIPHIKNYGKCGINSQTAIWPIICGIRYMQIIYSLRKEDS
jgi:hypothetical protein